MKKTTPRTMMHLIVLLTAWLSLECDGSAFTAFSSDNNNSNNNVNNIRLNKVFKETHSRRSADALIAEGRVKINGETVSDMGRRVVPYTDAVELDGRPYVGWEVRHGFVVPASFAHSAGISDVRTRMFDSVEEEYIKYWKPVGVTSTTDRSVPGNLIDAIVVNNKARENSNDRTIAQRIFNVGRLDKDSSGLLLLTSDGRLPNAVLRKEFKRPKVYHVTVDKPVLRAHVERLSAGGLVIRTDTVRQGKHRLFTAPALPCLVEPLFDKGDGDDDDDKGSDDCCSCGTKLRITLTEGRNRQIRVMLKTVGDYTVTELHRTEFMGIDLSGLSQPGDWTRLNERELHLLNEAMARAAAMELEQKLMQ